MALPDDYLQYKARRYGQDHDRYDWSILPRRKPVTWPNGAKLALWVMVPLEFFPLDASGKPFKTPGAVQTPYPDLRHYTLRDYGNRVGIFRLLKAFDRFGVVPSFALQGQVAERYPELVRHLVAAGGEIVAHSWSTDTIHHSGLPEAEERALIARTLDRLEQATGSRPTGWLSPARQESWATPDLLAEAGLAYCCDWPNDDMPYPLKVKSGALTAMPLSHELDDATLIFAARQDEDEFAAQVLDQVTYLAREAETQGGRVMALTLHPWIVGQPHRIGTVERVLRTIMARDDIWSATGQQILDAWSGQQG